MGVVRLDMDAWNCVEPKAPGGGSFASFIGAVTIVFNPGNPLVPRGPPARSGMKSITLQTPGVVALMDAGIAREVR